MSNAQKKIRCSKDYLSFEKSNENRSTNAGSGKRKKLRESMEKYGFIPSFPVVCKANGSKKIIKDGQHRFEVAESLGLPIWFTEDDTGFDIAEVNCCQEKWTVLDYAKKHSENGFQDYTKGIEFSENYGIPVGIAFALLWGTRQFTNIRDVFISGDFKIRDEEWATLVASVYSTFVSMSKDVRNNRFLEACMAICRVKTFNPDRLFKAAKRCRDKLVAYNNREANLTMLEEIYNFGKSRRLLVPLKIQATQVMDERNPSKKKTSDLKST